MGRCPRWLSSMTAAMPAIIRHHATPASVQTRTIATCRIGDPRNRHGTHARLPLRSKRSTYTRALASSPIQQANGCSVFQPVNAGLRLVAGRIVKRRMAGFERRPLAVAVMISL